ncbi:MAG TPA: hypothetical protein VH374_03925 [Polyangia bacterium]|jgi:hypothetical protein|nr:hypothetical protein [Polyangia bacterium]
MIEVFIPEGRELPLDEVRVAELVAKALYAAERDLRSVTPPHISRAIYRPTTNGWAATELPFPHYRARIVWDAIDKVWNAAETEELTGYLWERGALKKKISTEGQVAPGKDSWARFVWGELIHGPLLHLLREAAIRELNDTGGFTPWELGHEEVRLAAEEIARRLCKSGRRVVALCPVVGLALGDDCDRFESEVGVVIYRMTEDRKRLLLSRFESEFVDEDMLSWAADALVEITQTFSAEDDDDVARSIASALDRIKWSTLVTAEGTVPVEEGPVIIRGPAGWRGRTLRRGDPVVGNRSWPHHRITEDTWRAIAAAIEELKKAESATVELEQAVWHFGRSCTATIGRDIVLESAIGLEHLLVPDSGEATYKLSVHGLALLGASEGFSVADELVDIYRMRSQAAHGSGSSEHKFKETAPRARMLLAKAIWAIVRGINGGSVRVTDAKGDIGKAVKAHFLRMIARAVQPGVEPDGPPARGLTP